MLLPLPVWVARSTWPEDDTTDAYGRMPSLPAPVRAGAVVKIIWLAEVPRSVPEPRNRTDDPAFRVSDANVSAAELAPPAVKDSIVLAVLAFSVTAARVSALAPAPPVRRNRPPLSVKVVASAIRPGAGTVPAVSSSWSVPWFWMVMVWPLAVLFRVPAPLSFIVPVSTVILPLLVLAAVMLMV